MVYLDNAATGFPKSNAVWEAMQSAFFTCGNPSRGSHEYARNADEILYRCRILLAKQFGALPEGVVLTKNATEALNLAVKGLYREGGEVLTSDMEHNAVLRPLHALRTAGKITVKQFRVSPTDDNITVENFRLAAGKTVSLAVVTHASNVCGKVLPLKEMRDATNRKDLLFVADCSQTAGHIPIDICQLGADVICIPGHKGLYGPMGTGALICHPERHLQFRTLLEGGSGIHSLSMQMPETLPERLEAGTQNVYGFAGLAAALEELIFEKEEFRLAELLAEKLRKRGDVRLFGAGGKGQYLSRQYMPVLLLNKQGVDCEALAESLADKGIAVRGGFHCAPAAHRAIGSRDSGGVRVSFGRSNTIEDVQRFLDAI